MIGNFVLFVGFLSCSRPSAIYEVGVFGEGSTITDVQSPPQEKSGIVEFGSYRIFGSELGLGFTGMYADIPDSSGTAFVMGQGVFAYPPDESFDRISTMITTGPTKLDSCMKIISPRVEPSSVEYVDVGDSILLQSEDILVSLPREPKTYPRPAGESWFVGYGYELLPRLENYSHKSDTWSEEPQEIQLSFKGGLPPKEATVGAIPFPFQSTIQLPESLKELTINDQNIDEFATTFVVEEDGDISLNWNPASESSPLTISIRALGEGEPIGNCTCNDDCGVGMICSEKSCYVEKGATDDQKGELVCTLKDDGDFLLESKVIQDFQNALGKDTLGYLLVISRMKTGNLDVPDVYSHNGKKIPSSKVRWRTMDNILTRLEMK